MKRINIWIISLLIITTGISCTLFSELFKIQSKSSSKNEVQIVYDINDPFSEQKVRDYLKQLHVKYPDVALAQMKLESTNGTSKIFREGNNLFGMKLAQKRPTTALGERNGHAYYSHWRSSCIDYALYQAFVSNTENLASEDSWLEFIGRAYAEDDSYKKKLTAIKKKIKKEEV